MKLIKNRRTSLILLSILIVAVAGLATAYFLTKTNPRPANETPNRVVDKPKPKPQPSLKFAAMGDMLAHGAVINQARTENGYDFKPYFTKIQPLYAGSDVVFCNPETPAAGPDFGISGYPVFNAPIEFSRDLSAAGCNLINFATNHIVDKGQTALDKTLDEWDKLKPLAMSGANRSAEEQQKVSYFEKNGLKVAFVAFADFSNAKVPHGYSINFYHDKALVTNLLTEARKNADIVIVSAHWGVEDSHQISAPQQQAAQMMADLGADVIIGTGPHVLQPVTWLDRPDGEKTLVWYSIGNMLSSQFQVDELTGGVAKFKVAKVNDKLRFSDIAFDATFMSYEWSAADKAANRSLARNSLKLQPLKEAVEKTKLFGTTVEERTEKVHQWLGKDVEITIRP